MNQISFLDVASVGTPARAPVQTSVALINPREPIAPAKQAPPRVARRQVNPVASKWTCPSRPRLRHIA